MLKVKNSVINNSTLLALHGKTKEYLTSFDVIKFKIKRQFVYISI